VAPQAPQLHKRQIGITPIDCPRDKCREQGRIVNVACVVATARNADGHREILGMDVLTSEDGAGWTSSCGIWSLAALAEWSW
jgi:transposase-like protein